MRLILFIIINILLLNSSNAYACYYQEYKISKYTMFRITNEKRETNRDYTKLNCLEWQSITDSNIPLDDIYKFVYKYSLEEIKSINKLSNNRFSNWIIKNNDNEILELLILAKESEEIRCEKNSQWYYAVKGDSVEVALNNIAKRAAEYSGTRLTDRYALQYVRVLFSLSKYNECISYREEHLDSIKDGVMKQMIEDYINGAYVRVGKYDPNSEEYILRIQEKIQSFEVNTSSTRYSYTDYEIEDKREEFMRLKETSLGFAKDENTDNPAMWYYTAAFISDLYNSPNEASQLLTLAENAKSSTLIDESIKVFRIYLDAKLCKYDNSYYNKLYGEIKWLASMADKNLTNEVIDSTLMDYYYYIYSNESYFYWNDMLRRIVIGEVCPKAIKQGDNIKAMQLANMAEYGLINRIESVTNKKFPSDIFYSNNLFTIADTVDVKTLVKYKNQFKDKRYAIANFYNSNSNTKEEFWNDLIGTKYIRSMQYKEAVKYLSKLPQDFDKRLITASYMNRDPFSLKRKHIGVQSNYKLSFAKRMSILEDKISASVNPNTKAEYMIEYAIAIRNSQTLCWPLSYYSFGYINRYSYTNNCRVRDINIAIKRAEELIKEAFNTFTDNDKAANAQKRFNNYKTIIEKYPNTAAAKEIRGACDGYYDYHAESAEVYSGIEGRWIVF